MREKRKLSYGYVIVVVMCLCVFVPNYAQYQVSAFKPELFQRLGIAANESLFSSIATAPLIPGIFLSLISGILVDRFGARAVIGIAVTLSTAAVVVRVFCSSYWQMYLIMICIGLCAAFINANCAKVFGQWFPPEKASVTMGVFMAFANGSIALGTGTAPLYGSMTGAFTGAAVIAVIALICWWVFMKNRPIGTEQKQEEKISVLEGLKVSLSNRHIWLAAVCMLLSAGCVTAAANFLPSALISRGMSDKVAPVVTMALTLGALLSNFTAPSFIEKTGRYKLLFFLLGAVAALGLFLAWRVTLNPVITFILLFIAGYCSSGFTPIIMSLPVRLKGIGTRYGGTAGGLLATIQLGGSVVLPTYVIAPIAGTNYVLMFSLFALMMVLFCFVQLLLPIKADR
jgi:NNP family nitrate/nitrite transporter-like MFS transporter